MRQRVQWVDLTKGLLISLVVLGHAMKGIIAAGLSSEALSHTFMNIHYALVTFRMPLFFMLSGYLVTQGTSMTTMAEYKKQFFKRLIRLGVPYLCFSLIEGVMRIVLNGHANRLLGWEELLWIPFKPLDHFWFIYTLIALFTLLPLLEVWLKNERLVLLTLFVAYLGLTIVNLESIPFLNFAVSNGIFLYSGIYLKRHLPEFFDNPMLLLIGGIPYVVFKALLYGHENGVELTTFSYLMSSLLFSISGAMLCIYISYFILGKYQASRSVVSRIGKYSYEIYILHVMALAAVRIALIKVHVGQPLIHLVLEETAGIAIPMLLGMYITKLPVLDFMLYPNRYIGRKTSKVITVQNQPVSIAS